MLPDTDFRSEQLLAQDETDDPHMHTDKRKDEPDKILLRADKLQHTDETERYDLSEYKQSQ